MDWKTNALRSVIKLIVYFFVYLITLLPQVANALQFIKINDLNIIKLAISPFNVSKLYCISSDGHFYKSLNGGYTWQQINNGLPLSGFQDLCVSDLTDGVLFFGSKDGIYKSIDDGNSWAKLSIGRSCSWISVSKDNILFYDPGGVHDTKKLYKSNDGGNTWKNIAPVNTEFSFTGLIDPNNENNIYSYGHICTWIDYYNKVCGYGYFLKSTDGGLNFDYISINIENESTPQIFKILVDRIDSNIIYMATGSGILKSTNKGTNWINLTKDIAWSVYSSDIIMGNDVLYAKTSGYGILVSNDHGTTWTTMSTGSLNIEPGTFLATQTLFYLTASDGLYVANLLGPVIQVTPSTLNFGYVPPGSYKDLILEVKNIGGGDIAGHSQRFSSL